MEVGWSGVEVGWSGVEVGWSGLEAHLHVEDIRRLHCPWITVEVHCEEKNGKLHECANDVGHPNHPRVMLKHGVVESDREAAWYGWRQDEVGQGGGVQRGD